VRQAAILLQPVIPAGANQLLDLLQVAADRRGFAALGPDNRLQGGTPLPKPEGVFPRLSALEETPEN
jgi:methionyl-tRNA synthetase